MGSGEKFSGDKGTGLHQEQMNSRESILMEESEVLGLDRDHRSAEEILSDNVANRVLPYLSLDKISDDEKADLISLAERMLESIDDNGSSKLRPAITWTLERILAKISGDYEDYRKNRTITPRLQEARKLFCACLLDSANQGEGLDRAWTVYNNFLSFSPNFADYCGGMEGSLELLIIAERTNNNPCARDIYDGVMYDNAFSKSNMICEIITSADPIKQLSLLPIISNIAARCDVDGWSSRTLNKISEALNQTEQSPETTPLVKIVSESISNEINDEINAKWEWIDLDNPRHADLVRHDKERREKKKAEFLKEQAELHEEFKGFSDNQTLVRLARGMVASINDHGNIDIIADRGGQHTSLLQYVGDNDFDVGQKEASLLIAAHNPKVRLIIEEKLGLELADIPLESQIHLLKFMTEANNGRFDRLCSALNGTDEKVRLKLAESFLATGFGEDFGDALLDIAESDKISGEQLEKILDKVSSCRESIRGITGFYGGFDGGDFAKQYERAANERLTDALAVFREIARNGRAGADLGWAGAPEFNYETAMEALDYEAKSLEIINGTLSDIGGKKEGAFAERILTPEKYKRRSMYRLYSPDCGYVLLYTRPEGSGTFNSDIEYGKRGNKYKHNNSSGVEASISFIVNPENPFENPNPHKPDFKKVNNDKDYYDSGTMDKVSAIRLDREGRAPNAPTDDPNRDPINAVGTVSVDLAAINDRWDTPSGKIARLFSVGGKLREETLGVDSSLNHNTHYFNQDKYGKVSGFKELVDYADSIVLEWCKDAPMGTKYADFMSAIRNMPYAQLSEIDNAFKKLPSSEKRDGGFTEFIEAVRHELRKRKQGHGKRTLGALAEGER